MHLGLLIVILKILTHDDFLALPYAYRVYFFLGKSRRD